MPLFEVGSIVNIRNECLFNGLKGNEFECGEGWGISVYSDKLSSYRSALSPL